MSVFTSAADIVSFLACSSPCPILLIPLFVKMDLLTQHITESKTSLMKKSGVCAHYTQVQNIAISFPYMSRLGTLCSVPQSFHKLSEVLKQIVFYVRQHRTCLYDLG